jgi:hypothetical protein
METTENFSELALSKYSHDLGIYCVDNSGEDIALIRGNGEKANRYAKLFLNSPKLFEVALLTLENLQNPNETDKKYIMNHLDRIINDILN